MGEDDVAVDVDSSVDEALAHALRMIEQLLARVDRDRVSAGGIGLPAPVERAVTGSVGPGNVLPRWIGRHPADELGAAAGIPFDRSTTTRISARSPRRPTARRATRRT